MSQLIAVTILTKNSQKYLPACLGALQAFEEVVILDNGSTDTTLEIAASFPNTRIVHSPFIGFGPLKNLAAQHATKPWVLSVDSDEVLSQELVAEILQLDLRDTRKVYALLRNNYYGRKLIRACGWDNDYVLRLYHTATTRFVDLPVHEYIQTNGLQVQRLRGTLSHFTYDSIAQLLDKMNQYSSLFAQENRFRKTSSPAKSYVKWAFSFFRNYVLQRGFLYGYEGLAISVTNANGSFYKYIKLHEENQRLAISLLIESHTSPEALAAVLKTAFQQTELPKEILVADSSSGEAIRNLVAAQATASPVPLRHCRSLNVEASSRDSAIVQATGEYLVLVDGSTVLHPDFLRLHRQAARKGQFVQGNPEQLSLQETQAILSGASASMNSFPSRLKTIIASLSGKKENGLKATNNYNLAAWREDVLPMDDANKKLSAPETELAVRLLHSGLKRKMLQTGVAYRLFHS